MSDVSSFVASYASTSDSDDLTDFTEEVHAMAMLEFENILNRGVEDGLENLRQNTNIQESNAARDISKGLTFG